MSLLNLNTSAGRGPRGKKSLKMFMGTGLLVAVLGIGSTLAANITINSPEGTSEFGQGVTQTIYCGEAGSATVKVTPASSYANSSSTKTLTNAKFITGTSGSGSTSVNPVTIYGSTSSNLPKFSSYSTSSKIGWWLSSSSTTATPITTQPTFDQVFSSPGSYFFTERNSDGTFKKPASSPSIQDVSIVMSNEISNFKLEKVTISNIPPSCTGVNFVLSSYGADSEAQELSDGASPAIKEVAVLWNGAASTTYPSRSRTTFSDTEEDNECLVTSAQTTTSLTFTFAEPYIPSKDLKKLVIETQEDAIGAGSCS
jgi:hypothetical protein